MASADDQLQAEREVLAIQAQLRESFRQTADVSLQARREQIRLAELLIEKEKDLADQGAALARVRAEEKKAEQERQNAFQTAIFRTAAVTQTATAQIGRMMEGGTQSVGQFSDQVAGVASSFGPWGAAAGAAIGTAGKAMDLLDSRTRAVNQAVVSTFGEVLSGSRSAGSAIAAIQIKTMQQGFERAASTIQ